MAANEECQDFNNSNNKKPFPTIFTEDNVPGASLKRRKAGQLKNDELKRWLRCRWGECIWNSCATISKVKTSNVCSAFPFLLRCHWIFCSCFIFRVKYYISRRLHNKVIDPDEGIHSNKKQFENNGNDGGNNVVEWPKEGWTLTLDNAPEFQHCFIFSYLHVSGGKNTEEKRRGRLNVNERIHFV